MTHWNYRILANITQHYIEFKICEVYYDKDNIPNGYSDVVSLSGDDLESIEYIFKKAKRAFKEPILYYGDKFPMQYVKNDKYVSSILKHKDDLEYLSEHNPELNNKN